MPGGERFILGEKPVSTGRGQPVDGPNHRGRQRHAILHLAVPARIILAATGRRIEKPAGDIGIIKTVIVFIAQLVKAAAPTAVTERFPLGGRHLIKGFCFPEGQRICHAIHDKRDERSAETDF